MSMDNELQSGDVDNGAEAPEKSLHEEISAQLESAKERDRDESGRFTAAEREAQKTEASAKVSKDVARETGSPATAAAPATAETPAYPNSWPAAHKELWASMTPAAQKAVSDREAEVHKGFTKFDEERNYGKQMRDAIAPYMPIIQMEGGNAVTAVQSLLQTAYTLRNASPEQKVGLFRQLAQQYEIPIADLFKEVHNQPQVHPDVAALRAELDQLKQHREMEVQSKQQLEEAQAHRQIDDFSSQPGHEHYDKVRRTMGILIQNGLAQGEDEKSLLEDAYQRAVYADPELRSTQIASLQQGDQAKRVADVAARAATARRAGSSVSGSPGAGAPTTRAPERTLREELQANLAAAQSN